MPELVAPSESRIMRFTRSPESDVCASCCMPSSMPHEMHVSPPRRMLRTAASIEARVEELTRVGGTTICALESKATTVTLSPSRRRSMAPTAAFMAFAMRSPFIEPERSMTSARFIGEIAEGVPALSSAAATCANRNVSPRLFLAIEAWPRRASMASVSPAVMRAGSFASAGSPPLGLPSTQGSFVGRRPATSESRAHRPRRRERRRERERGWS